MSLISINLLPSEFISEQAKKGKFYKVQSLGIAALLLMFFLSSLTVSLRILQGQRIKQVEDQLNGVLQKINGAKTKQDFLVNLKSRLTVIDQYSSTKSKQASLYSFIEKTVPKDLTINSLSIDRSGNVYLSLVAPDVEIMDKVMNSFVDSRQSGGIIKQVAIESLNRSRDGVYRFTVKLKTS